MARTNISAKAISRGPKRELTESPPLRGNVANQGERNGRANSDLDRVRTGTERNTRRDKIDPSKDLGGDQCHAECRTPLRRGQDESATQAGMTLRCPLLAQSGHHAAEFQCLLLGVKQTLPIQTMVTLFVKRFLYEQSLNEDAETSG